MTAQERLLALAEQTEVPTEVSEKLATMSDEAFETETESVCAALVEEEDAEQQRNYAVAVYREQLRRKALLEEKKKALEEEIATKRAIIAEKERVIEGLKKMRDILGHVLMRSSWPPER